MRTSLRGKILLLVVLAPLVLGAAALLTVDRDVRRHVDRSSIHESLEHSVAVFEGMLQTRSRALAGGGRVVVRDPRFFSLLMLQGMQRDARFTATVRGMATDFNRITQTDVFEVFDRRGRRLASVGSAETTPEARQAFVREALAGRAHEGLLVEDDAHFQAATIPVVADDHVVGVLLLGARVDGAFASTLKRQMRCEVTFLAGDRVTGTTLAAPEDRAATLALLEDLRLGPDTDLRALGVRRATSSHGTWLTLVRRIPGSDAAQAQMYVMQRAFDPETTFMEGMRRDLQLLAVLALLLALLSGVWLSNQILRPLQQLVRGAKAMEAGDYSHPIEVRHRDELGYLAERFVEMRRHEQAYVSSLEHAARLKSDFIRVASMELRAPISGLSAYHGLFAGGLLGPLAAPQEQALAAMAGFLARLTGVADDASLVAQVQGQRLQLERQPHEVEPMVRFAIGVARSQADGRPVEVSFDLGPLDGPVDADEKALTQAISHLVRNALHFAPDGATVPVRASGLDGRLRIEVGSPSRTLPAGGLDAMLRDGRLPDEEQDATRPTDFRVAGLALGLSIARSVAEAHGGSLVADETVAGTPCLLLELPLASAHRERDAHDDPAARAAA